MKLKDDHFFDSVLDLTKCIPYGRVTTYGAIAKAIGSPNSARLVGWTLSNLAHDRMDIPAHRVINRNGMLSGKAHFNPPELMQELLAREGILVVDDKVVNFKNLFWDPMDIGKLDG